MHRFGLLRMKFQSIRLTQISAGLTLDLAIDSYLTHVLEIIFQISNSYATRTTEGQDCALFFHFVTLLFIVLRFIRIGILFMTSEFIKSLLE